MLIPAEKFSRWQIQAVPHKPSDILIANMKRLEAFDLKATEQAKTLLIDTLFAEIVSEYSNLKIWKAATLKTDTLTGVADYLMAPRRAYIETPLLCVAEAKRDDFEQGAAQCIAEMAVCQWNNHREQTDIDIFGIVSNGQVWQFYKLNQQLQIFESRLYTVDDLNELLGALNYICAECAKNVPMHS